MQGNERRGRTIIAAFAMAACAGCATTGGFEGIGKDAYRSTFEDVIRKTLDESKGNNVCLPPNTAAFNQTTDAIEVNADADSRTPPFAPARLSQMRALEAAGLVTGTESTREVANRPQRFVSFRRTDKGASYYDHNTFCYARATLDRVVKWKGPIALGDYRAAYVYYTTKTGPIAEWATTPAVVAAFPTVAATLKADTPKVRQIAIDRSSEGWDVAEYTRFIQLD